MRKALPILSGIMLGIGIGIFIFFGLSNINKSFISSEVSTLSEPFANHILDTPSPNFELENIYGKLINLDDYRGHTVLINFWATWCAPCRLEMPYLQSRYERSKDKFTLLAVNNGESRDDVESFVNEYGLTFEVLLDPNAEVQSLFRIRGYPTTILIDSDGIIRFQHVGIMTEDQLDNVLQAYIADN